MKFYSDVTKKLYNTEEELNAAELAEKKIEKKHEEVKEAAAKDIKALMALRDEWVTTEKEIDTLEEKLDAIEEKVDAFIKNFVEKYANYPAVLLATQAALDKILDKFALHLVCED